MNLLHPKVKQNDEIMARIKVAGVKDLRDLCTEHKIKGEKLSMGEMRIALRAKVTNEGSQDTIMVRFAAWAEKVATGEVDMSSSADEKEWSPVDLPSDSQGTTKGRALATMMGKDEKNAGRHGKTHPGRATPEPNLEGPAGGDHENAEGSGFGTA